MLITEAEATVLVLTQKSLVPSVTMNDFFITDSIHAPVFDLWFTLKIWFVHTTLLIREPAIQNKGLPVDP
jgi:hypothetical protein